MIASLEKNDDLIAYWDMIGILETTIRVYQTTQNHSLLIHIGELNESCDRLKLKLETHDYTEDDLRRSRVEIMLKKYYGKDKLNSLHNDKTT